MNRPTYAGVQDLKEVLRAVPKQPQVQYSLDEQLMLARMLCNHFGVYDAADYLRKKLER